MLKHNIKIAFRNLIVNKIHSSIKIISLSLGVACSILIFLWIRNEKGYDKFHKNLDNIYLVTSKSYKTLVISFV